jgi:alpha-N-arabinofuranosidase
VNSSLKSAPFAKQVLLLGLLFFSPFSSAQTQPVHASIDASKTGPPISKYIYGQFLEHGGNIVNETG